MATGWGTNSLANSLDGSTWTGLGTSIFSAGYTVAFGNGRFIAGGTGINTLAVSTDLGVSFRGLGSNLISPEVYSVYFGAGLWIATGGLGPYTIATSDDGLTFIGQTSLEFRFGNGVASDETANTACGKLPSCSCSGGVCTMTDNAQVNDTLAVGTGNVLVVQGSFSLAPAVTLFVTVEAPPSGPQTRVIADATVDGTLHVVASVAVPNTTLTVLRAASISGTFRSVITSTSNACLSATSVSPVYSATTITMALQVQDTCSGQQVLPLGAIIGIAVGGAAVVCLAVVLIVRAMVRARNRSDALANRNILVAEMQHH